MNVNETTAKVASEKPPMNAKRSDYDTLCDLIPNTIGLKYFGTVTLLRYLLLWVSLLLPVIWQVSTYMWSGAYPNYSILDFAIDLGQKDWALNPRSWIGFHSVLSHIPFAAITIPFGSTFICVVDMCAEITDLRGKLLDKAKEIGMREFPNATWDSVIEKIVEHQVAIGRLRTLVIVGLISFPWLVFWADKFSKI